MEVHFTAEEEARLRQMAIKSGIDAEHLMKNAALRLLERNADSSALPPGSVVAEMRLLRTRLKPDPQGWTTRDYVQYGRR